MTLSSALGALELALIIIVTVAGLRQARTLRQMHQRELTPIQRLHCGNGDKLKSFARLYLYLMFESGFGDEAMVWKFYRYLVLILATGALSFLNLALILMTEGFLGSFFQILIAAGLVVLSRNQITLYRRIRAGYALYQRVHRKDAHA